MSSDRLRTQLQFENILGENDYSRWERLRDTEIKEFVLTAAHNIVLNTALINDSLDFYYKGIYSLYEAVIAVNRKSFSWATIKGYYSLFYFLRSSLCSNGIAFVRKGRDCYYFQNSLGDQPKKVSALHKSDHKAAIELSKIFNGRSDILQSNNIDSKNPYEWLMYQRENVNYKFRTFFEPGCPVFWSKINEGCDKEGINHWLQVYTKEIIYAFMDEHACLALPIQRLILTHKDICKNGIKPIMDVEKAERLLSIVSEYPFLGIFKDYQQFS